MFDFKNSIEQFYGNIYDYISQEDIYFKCLGYYPNEKDAFKSPFSEDKNPSLRFKYRTDLIFKCFSSNQGGDAIHLVSLLQGISYKEAINYIYNNFPIHRRESFTHKRVLKQTKIEVIIPDKIPFSFYEYWNQFHVSASTLDFYNIKPAQEVWINDNLVTTYKDNNPVIRYLINGKYKIYQPYNKKIKWLSNTRIDDIQGFRELPTTGDLLIISKAMKDILVWHELGFNTIALCSETANLKPEVYNHLKGRFKKIICFLDNDKSGITTMENYYNQYNIPYTYIPKKYECKDLAEFVNNYCLDSARELLNELNL